MSEELDILRLPPLVAQQTGRCSLLQSEARFKSSRPPTLQGPLSSWGKLKPETSGEKAKTKIMYQLYLQALPQQGWWLIFWAPHKRSSILRLKHDRFEQACSRNPPNTFYALYLKQIYYSSKSIIRPVVLAHMGVRKNWARSWCPYRVIAPSANAHA